MPFLVDDDLRFEDGPGAPRAARWSTGGCAAAVLGCSGAEDVGVYARVVKAWMEFCSSRGVGLLDSRERLKDALGGYAEYRAAGPLEARFAASTWGQAMSILGLFYRWAMDEGMASAEPFTYRTARALFDGTGRQVRRNLAVRRTPKPHVTIKYLEGRLRGAVRAGSARLLPDGSADPRFHGRELARNAAVAQLALATGLRLQEFTYLLPFELPPLRGATGRRSRSRCRLASLRPQVPDHMDRLAALAEIHQYVALDRDATVGDRRGPPGPVGRRAGTGPDARAAGSAGSGGVGHADPG